MLAAYTKQTSGQYIYKLERAEIPRELEKPGEIYHKLYQVLKRGYSTVEIFRIFKRVYQEHFTVVKNKVTVKKNEELHSGILQSPDDIDATYRKKGKKDGWGQSVNVTETANPENELNLLTDIAVQSNSTDGSNIMNDRIEPLKEKTPDIKELYTDGGYGSEDNDRKFEELGITHIQTAVRERKSKVDMTIEKITEGEDEVSCPRQKVKSEKTRSRYKACFDKKGVCRMLACRRLPDLKSEGTAGILFGRIHRYLTVNPDLSGLLGLTKAGGSLFLKNLVQIGQKVYNIFRFVIFKVKAHWLSNFEIKYYQVA